MNAGGFETGRKTVSTKISMPKVAASKIPHKVASGTKTPTDFIGKAAKM